MKKYILLIALIPFHATTQCYSFDARIPRLLLQGQAAEVVEIDFDETQDLLDLNGNIYNHVNNIAPAQIQSPIRRYCFLILSFSMYAALFYGVSLIR
jgi:hypothetical protein